MLSIHESGLLQVWKRRWWPKAKAVCPGSIVTEAKPISIVDVQSAFFVAAGGAVLGKKYEQFKIVYMFDM